MRTTQRVSTPRGLIALLIAAFLIGSSETAIATAQENPIGRNSFTSSKFGTQIDWSRDWVVDRDQSALEQSRDILFLNAVDFDAAIFIELRSQKSFRTADQALEAFLSRLGTAEALNISNDNTASYPPNLTYQEGRKVDDVTTYIQAQVTDTAMMISAIVAVPDTQEDAFDLATSTITVDGVPLFEFKPLCDAASTGTSAAPIASGGSNKTAGFGKQDDATPTTASDCVAIPVSTATAGSTPTPTPTSSGGKTAGLNDDTYTAPTFDVSFNYNTNDWELTDDLAAADNDGRDTVQLDSIDLASTLVIESYDGHGGRASTCIDLSLREWGILPGENEVLTDSNGNELVGSTRGRVWGAYAFTFVDTSTESDEEIELNAYVECRAMPGGQGVVVITLLSQPDDFLDAYEALQPILSSLRIG
ncbi:hypothetical protein BH09CHL1_BH09CHL1_26860 [soil metagenome]